ncbi:MAG: DnaJ domain-containing protein [Dehalococcoidales bacterium]
MKDYYQILGVAHDASQKELKSAFRKLAFAHHPDTNPGREKQAEDRFKEINEAYAVLGDRTKRQHYDLARKGRFAGFGYRGEFGSQQDIFQGIFSNQAMFNDLNRMFGQAGLRFDRDFLNQVFFSGRGTVFRFYTGPARRSAGYQHRPSGEVPAYKPGWFERLLTRLTAKIGRFLLKNLLGIEYTANLDLHIELELLPDEAAAGGEKEVIYKRGRRRKRLMVKVPPGVKPGTRVRLKGMGLAKNKRSGDLYLHVKLKKPPPLVS